MYVDGEYGKPFGVLVLSIVLVHDPCRFSEVHLAQPRLESPGSPLVTDVDGGDRR